MTDESRMRQALQGALDELMSVIGVPTDPEAPYAARLQVDEHLVDPERLPASVWRAACFGQDIIALALCMLDDDGLAPSISVEEGLGMLSDRRSGGAS